MILGGGRPFRGDIQTVRRARIRRCRRTRGSATAIHRNPPEVKKPARALVALAEQLNEIDNSAAILQPPVARREAAVIEEMVLGSQKSTRYNRTMVANSKYLPDWAHASEPFDELKRTVGALDLASANEAQTRYDVIDGFIRDVLAWQPGQVKVEELSLIHI